MKRITLTFILVTMLTGCRNSSLPEIQSGKTEARELIIKSLKELNNKDIKNTMVDLENALKADPSEIETYFLLGQIFLRAGQSQEAVQVFEHAAQLFPEDGTIFYMLAIAANSSGRKAEALAAAQRSVEIFARKKDEEEVYKNSMVMAMVLYRSIAQ